MVPYDEEAGNRVREKSSLILILFPFIIKVISRFNHVLIGDDLKWFQARRVLLGKLGR